MRICVTIKGPGTDRQGLYQIPGETIKVFWNYQGSLRTYTLASHNLPDCEAFLEEHGVEL